MCICWRKKENKNEKESKMKAQPTTGPITLHPHCADMFNLELDLMTLHSLLQPVPPPPPSVLPSSRPMLSVLESWRRQRWQQEQRQRLLALGSLFPFSFSYLLPLSLSLAFSDSLARRREWSEVLSAWTPRRRLKNIAFSIVHFCPTIISLI
jgi:hypothetical protein